MLRTFGRSYRQFAVCCRPAEASLVSCIRAASSATNRCFQVQRKSGREHLPARKSGTQRGAPPARVSISALADSWSLVMDEQTAGTAAQNLSKSPSFAIASKNPEHVNRAVPPVHGDNRIHWRLRVDDDERSKGGEVVQGPGCEESTDLSACRHVDSVFFRQKKIASRMPLQSTDGAGGKTNALQFPAC